MSLEEFAKSLFHAFADAVAASSVGTTRAPTWETLTDAERNGWLAVARAADDAHRLGRGAMQTAGPMGPRVAGIPFVPPDPNRPR